jgi:hypothetical protein
MNRPLKDGVPAILFKVANFERIRDPSRTYSIARRIGYRLERKFGGTFETIGREIPNLVLFNPENEVQELKLEFIDGTFIAVPSGKITLTIEEHTSILAKILERMLTKGFFKSGYEGFGRTLRKPEYRMIFSRNNNPIRFYLDAFRFSCSVFDDGKVGIWIDAKGTIDQPVSEFIEYKLRQGMNEEDIRKLILEEKMYVTVEPGYSEAILVDVIFERTAETFILKDDPKRRTLAQYWEEEFRKASPSGDYVVLVRKPGSYRDLAYPASHVHFSTKGESIPFRFMQLLHRSPSDRILKIQGLVRGLNLQPLMINGSKIIFNEEPTRWEDLAKENKCKAVGHRKNILLRMGKDHVATDQREVLKVGPYSGKKDINAVLVVPSKFRELADPFGKILQEYYEEFQMGKLNFLEVFEIPKLTPMTYWEKGYEIGRYFDLKRERNKIAVVALPEEKERTLEYFEFRRGIGRAKDLASKAVQMILPETMKTIINTRDRNFVGNILLQLYLKTLDRGEAIWLLENPAGNSKSTCYMGYDVSRISERIFDPSSRTWIREKKEAAAYAAVCDSHGRVIECRALQAQRGEMLTPDDVLRLLFETLHECNTAMKDFYQEDFNRLVMYRDGRIPPTDLKMIELGIDKLFEAVRDKYSSLTIDVVAVVKTGIERLFTDELTNPGIGEYVILDDRQAIVCTSALRGRSEYISAKPIKLHYALSKSMDALDRKKPMETLIHEFVDLTKLDWVSLVHTPKLALPLILVQEIGKLTVRDVSIPKDVPYIPL